jgi:hypothetical protein
LRPIWRGSGNSADVSLLAQVKERSRTACEYSQSRQRNCAMGGSAGIATSGTTCAAEQRKEQMRALKECL